jgi:hypothetical protein
MLYRWWRIGEEDRERVWGLYGWYCCLMSFGSCVGAVAWAARMMQLVNLYKGNDSFHQTDTLTFHWAIAFNWRAVFSVTYAIEFMCMCAALLMVLDRMSVFAAPQGTRLQKRWAVAGRIVMAVVVLGNAVGLAANVASAVHFQRAAEAASTSSTYYTAKNSKDGGLFKSKCEQEVQLGSFIASVQSFCEVVVLLLIVVAFVAVGVLSMRRVSANLFGINPASVASATGRSLRLRIVGTTAFVFVAFVVRSSFSTMYAVTYQLQDVGKTCASTNRCDLSCAYNSFTYIMQWMLYTPEFQLMITLVSSPLALLVALWGMTSTSTLQLMKLIRQDNAMLLIRPAK